VGVIIVWGVWEFLLFWGVWELLFNLSNGSITQILLEAR
jgi:hypothetical protein